MDNLKVKVWVKPLASECLRFDVKEGAHLNSEPYHHHFLPSHTGDPPAQQPLLWCVWSASAPACSMCSFLDYTWNNETKITKTNFTITNVT